MTQRMTWTLFNPVQGYQQLLAAWVMAKAMLIAGRRMVITLMPESKTREQEKKYHAMIGDVTKQAQHLGAKWGFEDWKRLLIDKFARETGRSHGKIIPNLDQNGVVEVGVLSRNFNKSDGSEFIEWLNAWGAENGIQYAADERIDHETGELI